MEKRREADALGRTIVFKEYAGSGTERLALTLGVTVRVTPKSEAESSRE